jgi:hypothetical protein
MANRKKEVYKPKPMTEGKRNLIQGLLQEYDIQSAEDSRDTAVLCVVYSVIPSSTTRLSSIDSASFDDIHYPVSHQIQLVNIVCRFHLDNLYHKNNYRKSIPHK